MEYRSMKGSNVFLIHISSYEPPEYENVHRGIEYIVLTCTIDYQNNYEQWVSCLVDSQS